MVYDVRQTEEYIRRGAAARGIDPDTAVRVAKSEGLGPGIWQSNYAKGSAREPSYGPFQLLVGGEGTSFPAGMGNDFIKRTGLDPSNPSNLNAGIDFALDHAAKNGWGAWYGAAKAGVGKRDGIGGTRVADAGTTKSDGAPLVAEPKKKTGTDPFDPWLSIPSLGTYIGPMVFSEEDNRRANARREELKSGAAEVPPMRPSVDYSTVRNALLSLPERYTSADAPWYANPNSFTKMTSGALGAASEYIGGGISDLFWTPEKDVAKATENPSTDGTNKEQQALLAALQGQPAMGTNPTQPGVPSQANAFATGIPVPNPPAQPLADPYVIPAPPGLQAPGNAPEIVGPDYGSIMADRQALAPQPQNPFEMPAAPQMQAPDMSAVRQYFERAAPRPMDDSQYMSGANWANVGAALSAAAGGNPADIFANFGMTLSGGNKRAWDSRMERALRDQERDRAYAMQGVDFESGIASQQASVQNQNAQSTYRTDTQNAQNRFETAADNRERQRQFQLQGLDFRKGMAEQGADLANKNSSIRFGNEERQRTFQNDQAATEYDRTQQNAANAYKVAQENAQRVFQDASSRYELTVPKILRSDKDGLVVQKVRNNAQGEPEYVYEVRSWGDSKNALDKDTLDRLDALKKTFGPNTPSFQIAKYNTLMNAKDISGLKFEMARDAANGGYLDSVLGESLGEEADNRLSEMGVQPGLDKDYVEKRSTVIANIAAAKLDLTNPEVLRKFAQAGNQGAALLLQASGVGAK